MISRYAVAFVGLFLVLVMHSSGSFADGDEEREQREKRQEALMTLACRDEEGRPESWLDRSHSYLNRRLCEPAAWFDGFFGDPRSLEETPVGTFIRLRNAVRWDQTEGTGFGVQVRANISLPRVSERVRLLLSRDEDLTGDFGEDTLFDDRADGTRFGLRFIAAERVRQRFDIDGTVRVGSGGLNPRVTGRYRHVRGLTPDTLVRTTQLAFWEREDGLGTTSRLDWEWLPNRDRLVRMTGQGTFSEASDGVDWRTSVVGFQQLDKRAALRAEVGSFGRTRPSFDVEEYFVAVRYRRQFLRHWLFFEVQPEHAWPLDFETGQRRRDWRLTFTVEVQFENETARRDRLRRYLGEEGDHAEWDLQPIPVDAPGERADDPVMEAVDDEEDDNDPDDENGEAEHDKDDEAGDG